MLPIGGVASVSKTARESRDGEVSGVRLGSALKAVEVINPLTRREQKRRENMEGLYEKVICEGSI